MLILDSNTISYYFRGDPQVVSCLQAGKGRYAASGERRDDFNMRASAAK